MVTGVSHQRARLRSLSALTGVGFTTSESETIVNHPVRRRILILIMLIGNAGVATEGSTLVLSFVGVTTRAEGLIRGAWLVRGLTAPWLVARSQWIERHMPRVMGWALRRWTDLEAHDFFNIDANGIVQVSARDKGTDNEQTIKIESASGLSKQEIDRIQRDAQSHAAEDKRRRELAEARNTGEQRVYTLHRPATLVQKRLVATRDGSPLRCPRRNCGLLFSFSGEGGIRTHGTCYRTRHFQCRTFGLSVTSPNRSNSSFQATFYQLLLIAILAKDRFGKKLGKNLGTASKAQITGSAALWQRTAWRRAQ